MKSGKQWEKSPMPYPNQEWLERIAAHLERVSAGTVLTVEMVRGSREQIAISWDLLNSTEVSKVRRPDPK